VKKFLRFYALTFAVWTVAALIYFMIVVRAQNVSNGHWVMIADTGETAVVVEGRGIAAVIVGLLVIPPAAFAVAIMALSSIRSSKAVSGEHTS
jgi:hypothetical protein